MKKKLVFSMVVFWTLVSNAQSFVDLGLPSGTLWKDKNESGFYTYRLAFDKYGNKLPDKDQWEELKNLCRWVWDGENRGYKVVGPNGKYIFLPADGVRWSDKENYAPNSVGSEGWYWSSTPFNEIKDFNWALQFEWFNQIKMQGKSNKFGFSVRLTQMKVFEIIEKQSAYRALEEAKVKTNAEKELIKIVTDIQSKNRITLGGETYEIRKTDKADILSYADSLHTIIVAEKRIAEQKRKEEQRLAEEKRKEEERLAEEKRKKEKRLQKEYSEALSNLEKIDKTLYGVLWKSKSNPTEPVPVKGKEQEAKSYDAIRKELKIEQLLQKTSYKSLSDADIAAKSKADTFVSVFYALVYKDDYIDSLKSNAQQLVLMSKRDCPDVGKAYTSYFKSFPFSKSFTSYNELMKYYHTIMLEAKRQAECDTFIRTRKLINDNTVLLERQFADYKDIAKAYSSYISTADMSWNKDVTVQKLQPVLDQQNNIKEFIKVRKQITSLDKEILATGKKAKNIVKLYSSYLGEQDLSWSEKVTKEKITTIVELQQALLKGLQLNNIDEIDKAVKNQKINSIRDVFKLFR